MCNFSPIFLCSSFLCGIFGVASSCGLQPHTRSCTGGSGSHTNMVLASNMDQIIKIAGSIAQVNYKANFFLLSYKND